MTLAPPLPAQAADVPWPTRDWPIGDLPAGLDQSRFQAHIDEGFSAFDETHGLVIVQGGRLIYERYGEGRGPDDTCMSWSKAKSITQALVGILVKDGLIDIHARADVEEWQAPGDPRGAITLDQLLRMSSGLEFSEVYLPDQPSDTIEMMWGSGKDDVAHYAADKPLAYPVGSYWSYSSGTTNIVARIAARAAGATGDGFNYFMKQRLFGPLGMTSPVPKFDTAGTFIGSSFCFTTPRDFARFGLLYLRDGIWEGERILPEGWVDYARTPTPQPVDAERRYGAHWWLDLGGKGAFSANGHEGQYTVLVPDLDLIVVRHGRTSTDLKTELQTWIDDLVDMFRT